MPEVTLDFETYYDNDYSLRKITTEEYIRSPLFEVIGVAVKVDDGEAMWASGTEEQVTQWLQGLVDWSKSAVLCHNTMFDGAILSWRMGIKPRIWLDTLSMGRALRGVEAGNSLAKLSEHYGLGAKGTEVLNAIGKRRKDFTEEELSRYGDYCINDVELTRKLFLKMYGDGYPKKELKVIDLTLRMYLEPKLMLDVPHLTQHLQSLAEKKQEVLELGGVDKAVLMSNPKFAAHLESFGVTPPMKVSKTTGKVTFAFAKTDDGMKELLEHPDLRVQVLAAARVGVKSTIEESRTERLLAIAGRGSLPVPIRYYAALTGRFGGDEKINLQNLPKRGPNGNTLRRGIIAPPGHVIIDSDSSQIEARTLAWLAGEVALVETFATGGDTYKQMASAIYGVPAEEVTKDQRKVGKMTVLGCGYGMGYVKFGEQLKVEGIILQEEETKRIVNVYRQTNTQIVKLWREAQQALINMSRWDYAELGKPGVLTILDNQGCPSIRLPNGMTLRYPGLEGKETATGWEYSYKPGKVRTKIYGGKLVENVIQALARIIITDQMIEISKRYQVVLTVHDALAVCVPIEEAQAAKDYLVTCMKWVPDWAKGLPVSCEAGIGYNYADVDK